MKNLEYIFLEKKKISGCKYTLYTGRKYLSDAKSLIESQLIV